MQRFGGTATPYYAIKGTVKELHAKVQGSMSAASLLPSCLSSSKELRSCRHQCGRLYSHGNILHSHNSPSIKTMIDINIRNILCDLDKYRASEIGH